MSRTKWKVQIGHQGWHKFVFIVHECKCSKNFLITKIFLVFFSHFFQQTFILLILVCKMRKIRMSSFTYCNISKPRNFNRHFPLTSLSFYRKDGKNRHYPHTKIRYLFAFPPRLLHRYSIITPSLVHRFDGVTMDMRWSNDGVTTMFLRCNDICILSIRH